MLLAEMAKKHSVSDFVKAFKSLMPLKEYQIKMLRANYKAGDIGITAGQMAVRCGWHDKGAANLHYGKLARRVGEQLGMRNLHPVGHTKGEQVLAGVLVDFDLRNGKWFWALHPQVGKALEQLKIV
jgi:5-methylcytosine-specific restriction enzyme A